MKIIICGVCCISSIALNWFNVSMVNTKKDLYDLALSDIEATAENKWNSWNECLSQDFTKDERKWMRFCSSLKNFFFLLSLLLILTCCQQTSHNGRFTEDQIKSMCLNSTELSPICTKDLQTIDLNPFLEKKSFELTPHIKEIKLVKLETSDNSLVDNIYKVIVTDSMIYIFDGYKGGGLVLFNSNGKFIKRIAHGGGPGELSQLCDVSYDENSKELITYQHPYLKFYSSKGEFLRQQTLPLGFYNFFPLADGYILKTLDSYGNEHLGDISKYTVYLTDKKFRIKNAYLRNIPNNANYGGYSYLYFNSGSIQITGNFNDTIYHYTSEGLSAVYAIDYSSKKLPENALDLKHKEFYSFLCSNDYYYFLGEYLETPECNVFYLRNDYRGFQTVVFRDKRNGKMFGGTNANFDISEIPAIAFPKTTFKDYLVSIHYPNIKQDSLLKNSHLLSKEDKNKICNLKEDDNPVVIFYQLKF